jgi:hypothetical protein
LDLYPTTGNEEYQLKLIKIEENVKQRKANKIWHHYILNLMKNKKLEFNKDVMGKLSDLFYELYMSGEVKNEHNLDKKRAYGDSAITPLEREVNDPVFLNETFFTIDNNKYTVKDFKQLLGSHPLVYREKYINKANFRKQFRLAVADPVRDHYLNKEAYEKSLDKHYQVKKRVAIWQDALQAKYQAKEYLNDIKKRTDFNESRMKGDNNYLSIYIDSLAQAYHHFIFIDSEKLNKIHLTKIQTIAMQPGVPYPFPFSNIPIISTRNKIDTYKRINNR